MNYFWIYIIGLLAIPLLAGYLNRHYKWVKQADIKADNGELFPLVLFALIFWPLTLFISLLALTVYGFGRYFIPK